MEFQLLFLAYQVICVIVFFEVLVTLRKNPWLKTCLLFILASLFVMNHFAFTSVDDRLQFFLVKFARLVYACSTMLIVIRLATNKIPKWIIGIIMVSVFFIIGLRIFYFNEMNIEKTSDPGGHIFTVGPELYSPIPFIRYTIVLLAGVVCALTFFYYRQFFLKMNKDDIQHKKLSNWLVLIVIPFFLLVIFGILGTLQVFSESLSVYLFSFFSSVSILSILFRPKFLNTTPYLIEQTDTEEKHLSKARPPAPYTRLQRKATHHTDKIR